MDTATLMLAAARAWPATEVEEAGGWLLRATPGLDRARSNGALPLVPDPDLALLEGWYATRGRPAAVMVEPLERLGGLDDRLAARGYRVHTEADVLTAPTDGVGDPAQAVALLRAPTPRWQAAWGAAEERGDADVRAHVEHVLEVVARPPLRAAFALGAGGAAVGVAVVDPVEPVVGLFSLATARSARRRGLGSAVLRALVAWGREEGAELAYLQVLRRNPAQGLYRAHGFSRAHGYHHRAGPAAGQP